ncbi:hypothetical protein [Bosea sp. 124]|uniref:hypothetical protein n=1 Tax=Bosea sp. 124 TaxID=2135642 RepID=UPI0011B25E9C|nr:hypothetical protein [Bosea sp. 124]
MIVVSFAAKGRPRGADRGSLRLARRMVVLQVPWIADPAGICQSLHGRPLRPVAITTQGDKRSPTNYRHCRFSDRGEML